MVRDADEDDDRPRAKSKEKPLPGVLIWSGLMSVCWGGVFAVYASANLYQTIRMLVELSQIDAGGREIEFTRGGTITLVCFYSILVILTLLGFFSGINLLRRSAFGGTLTIWSPGAAAALGLGATITLFYLMRGQRFFMLYLLGFMLTFVLSLAVAIFNGFVLYDRKNTKVLK